MLPERLRTGLSAGLATASLAAAVAAGGLLVVAPAGADTGTPADEPTSSTSAPSETPSETPTPTPTPTTTPTPTSTAEPSTGLEVDDAVWTWGVNNESSNRAHAPGTVNLFSAGKVPDPGRGGRTIKQQDWRQRSGAVSVRKWDGAAWRAATWAGLSTDSDGDPLGAPTAGTFSNHRFEFTGGEGLVDAAAGTAHIEWDGDVTVLYYSGMSFFYLSDPVLDVADGRGRVTATLSGFASSVDDQGKWEAVPPRRVTVADLPRVDLADPRGFVAQPSYLGVTVTGVPQQTGAPSSGAFPQSYVDFMRVLGTAAFWYSSGAATDPFKAALPLGVSYEAERTVTPPTPSSPPTQEPVAPPTPTPPPSQAPAATMAPPGLRVPLPAAPVAPVAAPGSDEVPVAASAAVAGRPLTQVRLAAAPVAVPAAGERPWLWWSAAALLL
ncbi:MAG: hypothetical protein Q8O61_15190, partial [Nocardioides sp.]|nr:hypothetical protein [Nocardioides sp.]